MHVVLSEDAYVPATQGAHNEEAAVGATHPGTHASHVLSADAPTTDDAVPGLHEMHPNSVCPEDGLYVPARHETHELGEEAPTVFENIPTPQGVQDEEL